MLEHCRAGEPIVGGPFFVAFPSNHIPKTTKDFSVKGKGLPQQAEVAQGVPGRLRPRIFLTFGTTRVVGRQPYAPATFTQGETSGIRF